MIVHGDCLDLMRDCADGTFTAIVTDPPYGLSFMGKEWDHGVPGVPFWEEALRVAVPGAPLIAFGGTRTYHRLACAIEDAGWEIRDCLSWLYGSGFPKSLDVSKAIDKAEPATDLARLWSGYGTALKPAWEPAILAMKPTEGTFAANAEKHGVAGLNIDAGRIDANAPRPLRERRNDKSLDGDVYGSGINGSRSMGKTTTGRWPANVALDEEAAAMLDEQSGTRKSGTRKSGTRKGMGYHGANGDGGPAIEGSEGGASRFFYCAKASKADRTMSGRVENRHPTVKPTNLMRWLVRMVRMPERNLILDPFAGSGSTGVACALEGVDFIGFEKDEASVETANSRISLAKMESVA